MLFIFCDVSLVLITSCKVESVPLMGIRGQEAKPRLMLRSRGRAVGVV